MLFTAYDTKRNVNLEMDKSKEKFYPGDVISYNGFDCRYSFSVIVNGHYYKNFKVVNEDESI